MENKQAVLYRRLGTATSVLNSEITKQIVEVNAVDTGRMRNVSIVKIIWQRDSTKFSIEIDSTFYYKFVDKGTKHITPREITKKLIKRPKVKEQFAKVAKALVEYIIWKELNK